jgi:hypothetical protein
VTPVTNATLTLRGDAVGQEQYRAFDGDRYVGRFYQAEANC